MNKIDRAISVVRYLIKKKRARIEQLGRAVQPSEKDKIIIGEETEFVQNVEVLIDELIKAINVAQGKLPPQDIALEEAIVGALILENSNRDVFNYLKADHFHAEPHRLIYACLERMNKMKDLIDMRTVVVNLRKSGHLEQVGGAHYIAELTSRVSSAANIHYHSRILVELAIKRELIRTAGDMMYGGYEDTVDAIELFDQTYKRIDEIKEWLRPTPLDNKKLWSNWMSKRWEANNG